MNALPPLHIPTPVLSLAVTDGGVWAGGVNGVSRYDVQQQAWQPRPVGFPISRVSALLRGDGWLLAGGTEGIARSTDDGATWQRSTIETDFTPITCFAVSPTASILLAGTLSGLLRSDDGGHAWNAIPTLEDVEIAALHWGADYVLAATNNGIYRSVDAGTTWQASTSAGDKSIPAITALADNRLIAMPDEGNLLVSTDGGIAWDAFATSLPADAQGSAIHQTKHGTLLLATSTGEVYHSADQGQSWAQVNEVFIFAFAEARDRLWAGTTLGMIISTDDGLMWSLLPPPPTHDLDRIIVAQDRVYVAGEFTGMALYDINAQAWALSSETPVPLSLLYATSNGKLFASSPDGLAVSTDHGENWEITTRGFLGHVSHLVLDPSGFGQAITTSNRYLLRTLDGNVWQGATSPFGNLRMIGLAINAGNSVVVTYDSNTHLAQICRSVDKGVSWECGEELPVQTPITTTYSDPLLIGVDDRMICIGEDGGWQMLQFGAGITIRKFVGNASVIVALTTGGLIKSADRGQTWQVWTPDGIALDQVRDIALTDADLYALTSSGAVTIPLA
jgi:photosystem II stability/assembly factor-like uncharacterized protein